MTTHLHILGILFVGLAALHIGFPRYFKWREELASLSPINRQMMYVHASFIAVTVFLFGLLCLTSARELVGSAIGRRVCLLLGIFWALRLLVQFFVYSPALWRGRRLETTVHVLFSTLWTYAATIFLLVAFG